MAIDANAWENWFSTIAAVQFVPFGIFSGLTWGLQVMLIIGVAVGSFFAGVLVGVIGMSLLAMAKSED